MLEICTGYIQAKVAEYQQSVEEWDNGYIMDMMAEDFLVEVTAKEIDECRNQPDGDNKLGDMLAEKLVAAYNSKEEVISSEKMRMLEKLLLLETIDRKWMDHLHAMDLLKEGIHLRGYAGQDPKIRYKVEGFEIFEEMWQTFEADVATLIMKISPVEHMELEEQVEIEDAVHDDFDSYASEANQRGATAGAPAAVPQFVNMMPKVGMNDPCPCGSGKKFKKCCGR